MTKELRTVKVFGRGYAIDYDYKANGLIKALKLLSDRVASDVILIYTGLETIDFYCDTYDTYLSSDVAIFLYDKYKNDGEFIRDTLLRISVEDTEWTAQRNAEYTGIFYRKIVLNADVQVLIKTLCSQYLEDVKRIKSDIASEKEREQREKACRQSLFSFGNVYKEVKPSGGENGRDGYFDVAVIRAEDGAVFRFVERDVFDFGCYCYPKRLEGTPECLKRDSYTEEEKAAAKWLSEFGRFHGIRM